MLEETRLNYALVTEFVEVRISIGSRRRLLLDDGQPVFRISTDKRASLQNFKGLKFVALSK
jgi:hypothetical protein